MPEDREISKKRTAAYKRALVRLSGQYPAEYEVLYAFYLSQHPGESLEKVRRAARAALVTAHGDAFRELYEAELREVGIFPHDRAKYRHLTDQIVHLYTIEGMSYRQIAGRLGVSYKTVQNRIAEAGVKPRPRGYQEDHHMANKATPEMIERWKRWKRMYEEQTMTIREIAKAEGSTYGTVHHGLLRVGTRMKPPSYHY